MEKEININVHKQEKNYELKKKYSFRPLVVIIKHIFISFYCLIDMIDKSLVYIFWF